MKILSLFDGMSCGQIALNKIGVKDYTYYSSEIEKAPIQVAMKNYPKTVQLGDVTKINGSDVGKIDLLIGGSPCQGFSFSGQMLNFKDPRSKLFFEYVRLLKELKPKYFLLENVKMKREWQDIISQYLGVAPVYINSKDFSAQSRGRLYWTNIPFDKDWTPKGITLADILEPYYDNEYISNSDIQKQLEDHLSTSKYAKTFIWNRDKENRILVMRPDKLKIQRIGRVGFGSNYSEIITALTQPYVFDGMNIRKVNVLEAERLQTVPDNYTDGVAKSNRYKMLGNGWTVDVIAHIFKGMDI